MVKDFLRFVEGQLADAATPDAKALAAKLDAHRAELESAPDIDAFLARVDRALAAEGELKAFLKAQARAWRAGREQASAARPGVGSWKTVAGVGAIALFVVALGFVLFRFIIDAQNLALLGDIAVARGLITFLVTMGAIGIAVVLIGAVFITDGDRLKERFDFANQILTALIAILGTIVGFYYGTQVGASQGQATPPAAEAPSEGGAAANAAAPEVPAPEQSQN